MCALVTGVQTCALPISQQQRLDAMTPAPDGERAQRVRRSFEAVRQQLQAVHTIPALDFHVITGPVMAETLHGHIIVANVSLADQIGRASCRERVGQYVSISGVAVYLKKKKKRNE